LFFDNGSRELHEAAIGIDLYGLSDFLEGRAGFSISVDEHGDGDADSRGSVPGNFGLRHDGLTVVGFSAHFPHEGYGTTI